MSGGGFPGLYALLASTAIVATAGSAVSIGASATGQNLSTSQTSIACTLTTTHANSIIVVVAYNQNQTNVATSVTDTHSLTWNARLSKGITQSSVGVGMTSWWALAATAQSYTITAHWTSASDNVQIIAFEVIGANTAAPFDPNYFHPNTASAAPSASLSAFTNTSNPGDLLLAFQMSASGAENATGYTGIAFTNLGAIGYKVSSSPVVIATVSYATLANPNFMFVDALQPPPTTGVICVDSIGIGTQGGLSQTTASATIVTSAANIVIIAWIKNINQSNTVSSVSGGSLTWTKRQGNSMGSPAVQNLEEWYAVKPTAGSVTVTATWGTASDNTQVMLIGYAQADAAAPFDTNGSVPAINNNNTTTPSAITTASVSTSLNGSMLIGMSISSAQNYYPGTAGEVWDFNNPQNNNSCEHMSTTTTFSSKALTWNYNAQSPPQSTPLWGTIVDALAPVPAGFAIHSVGANFNGFTTSGTTITDTITTTVANCLILAYADALNNSSGSFFTNAVTGGGLTWTQRNTFQFTSSGYHTTADLWWAIAPTAGTYTITNTISSTGGVALRLVAISGADPATPFDTANPSGVTATGSSGTLPTANISTNNANDMLIGWITAVAGGLGSTSPPSGWTAVGIPNTSTIVDQKIVTTTQSSTAVAASANATQAWGLAADAIRKNIWLDGFATTNLGTPGSTITSASVSLTTTQANDFLVAVVYMSTYIGESIVTGTVTSSGLTWTLRKRVTMTTTGSGTSGVPAGLHDTLELWSAPAPTAGSGGTITVSYSGTGLTVNDHYQIHVLAIKGTLAAFDSNGSASNSASNPDTSTSYTNPTATISTSNAHDLLLSVTAGTPQTGWTPASGYTQWYYESAFKTLQINFQEVTTTQSSVAVGNGSNGVAWTQISDAIEVS